MRGLVIGKFFPPHRGHEYLCRFAASWVDELDVVVCSLERESIPGRVRLEWMRELIGGAGWRVHHLAEELPQEPSEHPDFWALWERALRGVLPAAPEVVFASEGYGAPLADLFEARFCPVDPGRQRFDISGTEIRAEPLRHWEFLPEVVRAHYARRVCVFGPESTGKSTLAERLAAWFQTAWVPEYARTYLEWKGAEPDPEDMLAIARGQLASEDALARTCDRVLICDTDALTTTIWSEVMHGRCDPWIAEQARVRRYDLTLLCEVDVPHVEDPVRYLPEERRGFFARCERALQDRGRPCVVVRGSWDERWAIAVEAVEALLP